MCACILRDMRLFLWSQKGPFNIRNFICLSDLTRKLVYLRKIGWFETNLVGREKAFKHRDIFSNAYILSGKCVDFRREISLFSLETVSRGPSRISTPQICAHRERETGCLEYMIVQT